MKYPDAEKIQSLIAAAKKIVIMQADNPDGDSVATALALEQILHDMGKEPSMYCAIDMPTYLRYLTGWDRVEKDLPNHFDLSIIVDASTMTLFQKLQDNNLQGRVSSKPVIVLDHHENVSNEVPFASLILNDSERASTGELVYLLAKQLDWPLSQLAQEFIMTSILGDTQGLSNSLTTALTYRTMAELTEAGVNRPILEEMRREYTKMPRLIYEYKSKLIARTEFSEDGEVAYLDVPQAEINEFSPLYNPAPLIQGDMLQTEGVGVAIVFKKYDDGKVTAAIRANNNAAIAAKLAEHFGGGGHAYASGFKTTSKPFHEVKSETLKVADKLLKELRQETAK